MIISAIFYLWVHESNGLLQLSHLPNFGNLKQDSIGWQ